MSLDRAKSSRSGELLVHTPSLGSWRSANELEGGPVLSSDPKPWASAGGCLKVQGVEALGWAQVLRSARCQDHTHQGRIQGGWNSEARADGRPSAEALASAWSFPCLLCLSLHYCKETMGCARPPGSPHPRCLGPSRPAPLLSLLPPLSLCAPPSQHLPSLTLWRASLGIFLMVN